MSQSDTWFWVWTHGGPAEYVKASDFADAALRYAEADARALPIGTNVHVAAASRRFKIAIKSDEE